MFLIATSEVGARTEVGPSPLALPGQKKTVFANCCLPEETVLLDLSGEAMMLQEGSQPPDGRRDG